MHLPFFPSNSLRFRLIFSKKSMRIRTNGSLNCDLHSLIIRSFSSPLGILDKKMMAEYDQRAYQHYDQRGYQQHDQRGGYQQHDQHGYQPYDQQQQQHMQTRSTILERGRAVRLMRNGDPHFTGRTFVINQKKYPMLDVFLDDASQALRANFGAVRCIYTPKHGTRLRDISDFEDHRTYVAAGGERFKKLQ